MSAEMTESDAWQPETVRYVIARDDEPEEDGTPETHPWQVNVIRNGAWSGACCYETFAEALADYVAEANARHSHWEDGRTACPYGARCDAPDSRYRATSPASTEGGAA